jgi:hypothetical protein
VSSERSEKDFSLERRDNRGQPSEQKPFPSTASIPCLRDPASLMKRELEASVAKEDQAKGVGIAKSRGADAQLLSLRSLDVPVPDRLNRSNVNVHTNVPPSRRSPPSWTNSKPNSRT